MKITIDSLQALEDPKAAGERVQRVVGAVSTDLTRLVRFVARYTAWNGLFGSGVTTAGLLVGADMRRVLADRNDLDLILIPAETINDDGLFLDDDTFDALKASLSVPIMASYDFVDVLAGEPELAGAA